MSRIEDSVEYRHLIAQGIPEEVAWSVAWIDRAYNHLVRNGMSGAEAYAHAVTVFSANGLDIDAMTPEDVMYAVLEQGYKAQQRYSSLDPQQPEASFVLQHRPDAQRKPS